MNLNRIGIDIGATSIKSGLVSSDGTLIARNQLAVSKELTNVEFSQAVYDSIESFLEYELEGIGIGSFGPLNAEAATPGPNPPCSTLLQSYSSCFALKALLFYCVNRCEDG